jgi:hypothetical protein
MITDYVPGSYVTHDQLHIRGGHQTGWLVDGNEASRDLGDSYICRKAMASLISPSLPITTMAFVLRI